MEIENNAIQSIDKYKKTKETQRKANKKYYEKTKEKQINRASEYYYKNNDKYEYIIINHDKNDITKTKESFDKAFLDLQNKNTDKKIRIKLNCI